jgi:hypothetical protein
MLRFCPFEEGVGVGERRGSLDERHMERVRCRPVSRGVRRDSTGPPTKNGEGLGTTKQSPIKRGKVLSA